MNEEPKRRNEGGMNEEGMEGNGEEETLGKDTSSS